MKFKLLPLLICFYLPYARALDGKSVESDPIGCQINGHVAQSYTFQREPSKDGNFLFERLRLSLSTGQDAYNNSWGLAVAVLSKDQTYSKIDSKTQKQDLVENRLNYYVEYTNEENTVKANVVTDAATGLKKIQSLTVRQKIYNGALDLLLPLNINNVKCRFF